MTFLPIVERELRVAARRPGTYSVRLLTSLVALIVWLGASVSDPFPAAPSRSGASLFIVLSLVAFCFALFAGLGNTSDSLSGEKREGTLGLLFLTDLKGYDVVLGKLAATSLGALYGLLAVVPVLAIPLLMGGVTAGAFWRVVLVLLNTLFFSLASGMFVSALSRHPRQALSGTLFVVLFVTGGLPLAGFDLSGFRGARLVNQAFLLPSPGFAFYLATDPTTFAAWGRAALWQSLLLTHLLGWCLLCAASWIAPRVWKDKPASVNRLIWRDRWRELILGDAARRRAFRERLLSINPIFWLASRERQTASYPWIFLGAMGAIWVWAWGQDRAFWSDLSLAVFLTYALHLFMKAWMLTLSCNSLAVDRDNGALELMLSTPLSIGELLRGQWLALLRHFLFPVGAILLFDLFWLALGFTGRLRSQDTPEGMLVWAYVANMGMFVLDLVALAWVGMWKGVSSRRTSQAAPAAVALVLVLPWIIFTVGSVMLFLLGLLAGFRRFPLLGVAAVFAWFFIGLVVDAACIQWARGKLHSELRRVAAQRFSNTPGVAEAN